MLAEIKMELTKRELEVITLMSDGLLSKEIAHELEISKRTVETYIRKIYIKTNAHNRSNAVAIFLKSGRANLV